MQIRHTAKKVVSILERVAHEREDLLRSVRVQMMDVDARLQSLFRATPETPEEFYGWLQDVERLEGQLTDLRFRQRAMVIEKWARAIKSNGRSIEFPPRNGARPQ